MIRHAAERLYAVAITGNDIYVVDDISVCHFGE
jgi:hypothetical protein